MRVCMVRSCGLTIPFALTHPADRRIMNPRMIGDFCRSTAMLINHVRMRAEKSKPDSGLLFHQVVLFGGIERCYLMREGCQSDQLCSP